MIKRPMLSATIKSLDELRFPLMISPKLDGIRCLVHPERGPVTRSFKPIPNDYIRETLNKPMYHGFDGEILIDRENFNVVQSNVMAKQGKPAFMFWVFDNFMGEGGWLARAASIDSRAFYGQHVGWLHHDIVRSVNGVEYYEDLYLQDKYEGAMLRDPGAYYKEGRSTMREHGLMKLKRFHDAEGVVIGFVERQHNMNEKLQDEFGLAKRSSHKENQVGTGTLGNLVLQTPEWGEVHVGTGFTDLQRSVIWEKQEEVLGQKVTFKYQEVLKDKPRFPVFMRFRVD